MMLSVNCQFSQSTNQKIRIATSVPQFIGILLSLFRLWFRWRIRRLWWEDACALVACVSATVFLTSEWMYLAGERPVSDAGLWMSILTWIFVVWYVRAVRMSILFSVARIVHPTQNMRRIVAAFAVFISLVSLIFATLKVWWDTHDLNWLKGSGFYTMPAEWSPHPIDIYELSTDCISDAILVFFPIRLLWSIKLPTNQRRMLLSIFSSSIVLTMVSVFRAVSQLRNLHSLVGVAVDVEVASSVIVCNLLVIVTFIYRVSRAAPSPINPGHDLEDDDDFTMPITTRFTPALTTVDFSGLYSSGNSIQGCSSDNDKSAPRLVN